ncbi:MAG: WD40 repeat domain-containing protein, partial [Cyanobacteria bacterium J06643_5]
IPQNDNNQIPKSSYISLSCPQSLLDKKSLLDEEATEKTQTFPSIRSIAITKNESYLASAGDDGNVRIWEIEGDKLSCVDKKPTGQRLNTIDIKLAKKELLIVTGDDKNRVMLYRKNVSEIKNATGCK